MRRHLFFTLLLSGLTASVSFAQTREIDADSDITHRINQNLAALGYLVDENSHEWTSSTEQSLERIFLRLGRKGEDISTSVADTTLEQLTASGGVFPCPDLGAAKVQRDDTTTASVYFSGDLPEEYLADFYLRIAECYPSLLNPQPINGAPPSAQPRGEPIIPSFPVSRTRRSAVIFHRVSWLLGSFLRARDKTDTAYAAPGLDVDVFDAPRMKLLTEGEIARDASGELALIRAAPPPVLNHFIKACADLGISGDCVNRANIIPYTDRPSGEVIEYSVNIDHFEMAARFKLPASAARRIVTDAVDNVRQKHHALGLPYDAIEMQVLIDNDERAIPLSASTQKVMFCFNEKDSSGENESSIQSTSDQDNTESLTCHPMADLQDGIADQYNQFWEKLAAYDTLVRNAVGWPTDDGVLDKEVKTNVSVVVVDPGFDQLAPVMLKADSNCRKALPIDNSDNNYKTKSTHTLIGCFTPIDESKDLEGQSLNVRQVKIADSSTTKVDLKKDRLGHGVHIGHILMGDGLLMDDDLPQWKGFAKNSSVAVKAVGEEADRSWKTAEDGNGANADFSSNYAAFTQHYIFNRSYQKAHQFQVQKIFQAISAYVKPSGPKSSFPHFNVIAAPLVIQNDGITKQNQSWECDSGDSNYLVCLALTQFAIGVVPVMRGYDRINQTRTDDWVLMVKVKRSNASGGYDPFVYLIDNIEMLWVAAPGENILSADARIEKNGEKLTTFFRDRSGSSMATPIVTSLVARVIAKQDNKDMDWGMLKSWIYANATPLNPMVKDEDEDTPNKDFTLMVAGIVNFTRSIIGEWQKINIWRACDDGEDSKPNGQCLDITDEIYYEEQIQKEIDKDDKHTFALAKVEQADKIQKLSTKDNQTGCSRQMKLAVGGGSFSPCTKYMKENVDLESSRDCKFSDVTDPKMACLKYKIGEEWGAVDFNKVTHVVGLSWSKWNPHWKNCQKDNDACPTQWPPGQQ